MKVTLLNRHKLCFSACSIFTLSGFLTVLFMVFSFPFSLIITPLIISVTGLVIFLVYGVYVLYRRFHWRGDQILGENTHLLEVNLDIAMPKSSEILGATNENFDRKQSLPLPTPKPKVTYQHPTPMPKQSYLTEVFMARFKALGDFIRSRRHTVSESATISLKEISTDPSKSSRVHTKSESDAKIPSLNCSPNNKTKRKQLLLDRDETLFDFEFGAEQYDKEYKRS